MYRKEVTSHQHKSQCIIKFWIFLLLLRAFSLNFLCMVEVWCLGSPKISGMQTPVCL